jgi:hypothetical protein
MYLAKPEKFMSRQYLKRSWINPRLISRKSSIHGQGVFTEEHISKDEKLMEFGGDLVSGENVFSGKYRERSIWPVYPDHYLALPITDESDSLDEDLNHSCDANAWLIDEVVLVAKRDIKAGEEVTLDQGTWNCEFDAYTNDQKPCSCGASDCRKKLTKEDWKLSSVQRKYAGHFHPIIQVMLDGVKPEVS